MKTLELICWAEERHQYYCLQAAMFLNGFNKSFVYPEFNLFASKSKYAGWAKYSQGVCDYNLSYLLADGKGFEQTIAHEVAHFVIRRISIGAKSHGELFMFVLRDVFHCRDDRYHSYRREEKHIIQAKALLKIVKLNELKDAACRKQKKS